MRALNPIKLFSTTFKAVCLAAVAMLAIHSLCCPAWAEELQIGDVAPPFTLKNQYGSDFSLASRKDKGWTVLYFYPKAGTPGCTQEAASYQKSIEKIRALNTEVYGISADTVEAQKSFHHDQHLTFDMLADPDSEVIGQYGARLLGLNVANRWTFIIDPEMRIQAIEKDVSPATDPDRVAAGIKEFQARRSAAVKR